MNDWRSSVLFLLWACVTLRSELRVKRTLGLGVGGWGLGENGRGGEFALLRECKMYGRRCVSARLWNS